MSFAAPLFLLSALAVAIPIVLHMIQRRPAKRLPFATLRFLKISSQKTRRRKRVHDWLLLVLRAAVLLLIAAGLARPTLKLFGTFGNDSRTAVVILLDNSASMGIADPNGPRFEIAVTAAAQILDQLIEGDEVALVPTCGPAFPEAANLARNQDTVRQALSQCRVSYERANLTAKLRQARALLQKSDAPNRRIYIVSDMQQNSWEEDASLSRTDAKSQIDSTLPALILVDCQQAPKANAAVQSVELATRVAAAGRPLKVRATVASTSKASQQRRVEMLVDGMMEAISNDFDLPPERQASIELVVTFRSPGLHHCEVRLVGDDGSKHDDRRFFTVSIDQSVPIAIVKTERQGLPHLNDAFYLEQALAAGGVSATDARSLTILSPNDLATVSLDKFRVVFCVNVPALDDATAQRLADYVGRGGNLFWILGDNVVPEAYNQMNRAAEARLLPAPLGDRRNASQQQKRDSWHISFLEKNHPALSGLLEPASLFASVLVYEHVRCDADKGRPSILARLDDGEPLLTEKRLGEGRVMMLSTSIQTSEANLPLRPIFLPLITQLTRYLAETGDVRVSITAGQPIIADYPHEAHPVAMELIPPSGESLRLKTIPRAFGKGQAFHYSETYDIGFYVLQRLGLSNGRQSISVNFDADEVAPARFERRELEKVLRPSPVVFAENPNDLTSTFASLREGKSLWSAFLIAVLAGLILETYVSNRFTPRQG